MSIYGSTSTCRFIGMSATESLGDMSAASMLSKLHNRTNSSALAVRIGLRSVAEVHDADAACVGEVTPRREDLALDEVTVPEQQLAALRAT